MKHPAYCSLTGFGLAIVLWLPYPSPHPVEASFWVQAVGIPILLIFGLICGIIAVRKKDNRVLSSIALGLNVLALAAFVFTALLILALVNMPRINP